MSILNEEELEALKELEDLQREKEIQMMEIIHEDLLSDVDFELLEARLVMVATKQ